MTVNEGQWFAEIPVVRSGDLSKPARATLGLEGVTARWGLDFLPWFSQSVSWAAGEGGNKSIKVLILDDWFVEPTEQFKVSLRQLQGANRAQCRRPWSISRTTTRPGGRLVAVD
ncbi:hypothetical protein WH06_25565 [Aeromonas salmonicida subsp. salmonicida]|nr:hypothetical protein WH06_25565 [Aeromonas salmonicida subsp. salmonicida]